MVQTDQKRRKLSIVTLNTASMNCWQILQNMGRSTQPDILCLQECTHDKASLRYEQKNPRYGDFDRYIDTNVFGDLRTRLGNTYQGVFAPAIRVTDTNPEGIEFSYWTGLATFFKADMQRLLYPNLANQNIFILGRFNEKMKVAGYDEDVYPRNLLVTHLEIAPEIFLSIYNFQGVWNGQDNSECIERKRQTDKILAIKASFAEYADYTIILGDFNIERDHSQYKRLNQYENEAGAQFGIKNTRSAEYLKYSGKESEACDFIFPSGGIIVQQAWTAEAHSDHLAVWSNVEIPI